MLNSSQALAISILLTTTGMVVPQLSIAAGILSIAFDFYLYYYIINKKISRIFVIPFSISVNYTKSEGKLKVKDMVQPINRHLHSFQNCQNEALSQNRQTVQCCCDKPVHVRAYVRFRFGKWEFVREHCRSLPGR